LTVDRKEDFLDHQIIIWLTKLSLTIHLCGTFSMQESLFLTDLLIKSL